MAVRPGAAPRGTSVRRVGTDARPECRVRHVGCRVARTLDSVLRLRLVPPGGCGGSRPRVDGAPRPPGSVRSGSTPGASAKKDPWSGGPRVRVPCSRVLISCHRRYSWLRRAVRIALADLEPRRIRWRVGAVRATATSAVGILRLIGTYREGILVVILGWISLCCPQVCPTDLVPGSPLWESQRWLR